MFAVLPTPSNSNSPTFHFNKLFIYFKNLFIYFKNLFIYFTVQRRQGKIDECNAAVNSAGGDIRELRSLSEKVGQLEARRDAIVAENSRKHANLGTYEMTDPMDVLEKSAEEFATQVITVCPPLIILAFSLFHLQFILQILYIYSPPPVDFIRVGVLPKGRAAGVRAKVRRPRPGDRHVHRQTREGAPRRHQG